MSRASRKVRRRIRRRRIARAIAKRNRRGVKKILVRAIRRSIGGDRVA